MHPRCGQMKTHLIGGDNNIIHITKNRDTRADIFIKKPGQKNLHTQAGDHGVVRRMGAQYNRLLLLQKSTIQAMPYAKRLNPDGKYTNNTQKYCRFYHIPYSRSLSQLYRSLL